MVAVSEPHEAVTISDAASVPSPAIAPIWWLEVAGFSLATRRFETGFRGAGDGAEAGGLMMGDRLLPLLWWVPCAHW